MAEKSIGDLMRRVGGAKRFMNARNPHRILFEECEQAIWALVQEVARLQAFEPQEKPRVELTRVGDSLAGTGRDQVGDAHHQRPSEPDGRRGETPRDQDGDESAAREEPGYGAGV